MCDGREKNHAWVVFTIILFRKGFFEERVEVFFELGKALFACKGFVVTKKSKDNIGISLLEPIFGRAKPCRS